MKKRRIWLLSIPLIVGLLISGCASAMSAQDEDTASRAVSESYYDYGDDANYNVMVEEEMAYEEEAELAYESGSGSSASEAERMVIYNASLEIAVEDPASTMDEVIDMAEDAGGFVVSSSLYQSTSSSGSTLQNAYVTVRVPAGQLNSIMDAIKALTPEPDEDVISEYISGEDVTSEYTDLESQLRNLEAAEEALVELMEEAQDPEDVLDIFDELTYYRGEIEIATGRMQYLEESVALSSISVEIVAKESIQPIEIAGWEPQGTVKNAVEALINAGQFLADAAIWFGIFCLPFLIPLGVAVYFLVRLFRKRRAKKRAAKAEILKKQPPVEQPEEK